MSKPQSIPKEGFTIIKEFINGGRIWIIRQIDPLEVWAFAYKSGAIVLVVDGDSPR